MFKRIVKKSIVRFFFFNMLFIAGASTVITGYLWIDSEFRHFSIDSEKMRSAYIQSQREMVKNETEKAFNYTQYIRSTIEPRLKNRVKEKVGNFYIILSALLKNYGRFHNILDVLKNRDKTYSLPSLHDSNGYYFIFKTSDNIDPQINSVFHFAPGDLEWIKKKGADFIDTERINPVPESSVCYMKYIDFADVFLGRIELKSQFIIYIQKEILSNIGKIKFGEKGYVFVVDYNGTTLWNERKPEMVGKKVWSESSPEGLKVIKKARETAIRENGGFIEYQWHTLDSLKMQPKISFLKAIPEWKWIIGSGVYLEEIDSVIAQREIDLKKSVRKLVFRITLFFIGILGGISIITWLYSRRLKKFGEVFISFFKKAAISHEKIDKSKLEVEEFIILADSVNDMLAQRQEVENSLKESKEQLAILFRSITDGVIAVDTDLNVTWINRTAELLTGIPDDQAIGKPLFEVLMMVDEKTENPLSDPVSSALKKGEIIQSPDSALLICRDGTRRIVSNSAAPTRDKDGNIKGAVIVLQDITEKRKMQEEIQKAQKLESLGILAGGIAHDFNNLLTGILGNINLAKIYTDSTTYVYKLLSTAEKAAIRTHRLTHQLLTFASGGSPIKKIARVKEFVEEAVSFAVRGSAITCEYNISPYVQPVEVDEGQINQVLNNLIINAIQAMPNGGRIKISADNFDLDEDIGLPLENRQYVRIMIEDTGTGIPEDILKKIFDPYFTTKPKGSGLGLSSAYSIMKNHNGFIDVKTSVGEGTTFILYLPALNRVISGKELIDKRGREGKIIKGSGRILIMDDERAVSDIAGRMLTHLGYHTEVARDGEETLELYKKSMGAGDPFDLVIMDLTIPGGLGGVETIKKLREIDPKAKAIVSSGYSNDPVMADFKDYGFNGCIMKPYKIQELGKTIFEVLNPIE